MRTVTAEFKDSISLVLDEYLSIKHLSTSMKEVNLLWPFAPEELPGISEACAKRGLTLISKFIQNSSER